MKRRTHILILGLLIAPLLLGEGPPSLPTEELSWGQHCPDGSVCLPNKEELESVLRDLKASKKLFPESHGATADQEFAPYFAAIAEDAQIAEDFGSAHALMREFTTLPSSVDTFLVFSKLLDSPKRRSFGGPTLTFEEFLKVHKQNRADGLTALDFMTQALPELTQAPLGLSQSDALTVINRMLQTKDPFRSYSTIKKILFEEPPIERWSELKELLIDTQYDMRIDEPVEIPIPPHIIQERINKTLRKAIVASKEEEQSEADILKQLYRKQRARRKAEAKRLIEQFTDMDATEKKKAQIGESFETGFNPEIPEATLESVFDLFPSEEHRIAYLLKLQILSDPTLYAHEVKEMEAFYESEAHSIAAMDKPLEDVLADWERISYARNPVTGLGLKPEAARLFKDELAKHMASDPEALERHRDTFFTHLEKPFEGSEKDHVIKGLLTADVTLPGHILFPGTANSGHLFDSNGPYNWTPLAPKPNAKEIELTQNAIEDGPNATEVTPSHTSKILPFVLLGGATAGGIYLYATSKPKSSCAGSLKKLSKPKKEDYSKLFAKSSMRDPQEQARELLKDFENMDYEDTPWMTRAWKKIDRYFSELENHGVQVARPVVPFHLQTTRVHLAQQRGGGTLPTLVVPTAKGKEYKLWDVEIAAKEKTGPLSSVLTDRVRQAQLESALETLKLISEME